MEVKRYLKVPLIDPDSGEDLGLPLVGTMDLLVPEANGPLIVMFKVAARNNPQLETAVEIQLACFGTELEKGAIFERLEGASSRVGWRARRRSARSCPARHAIFCVESLRSA
jgi:hypothetical protein